MADLQRRRSQLPRRARERRAYRLVVSGVTATGVGTLGLVLAAVGIVGAWLPVLAFLVALLCAFGFRRTVS